MYKKSFIQLAVVLCSVLVVSTVACTTADHQESECTLECKNALPVLPWADSMDVEVYSFDERTKELGEYHYIELSPEEQKTSMDVVKDIADVLLSDKVYRLLMLVLGFIAVMQFSKFLKSSKK